ncbi:Aste57867_6215 [Aphanomyces stellatus]|uniref:Aste57867_6215 protein n=1 Tax=Aphanomyces stellatus TaxID=120398 RepID=A0A485KHH8_9STRA|nr:hypothetical protein As57867_006201 [Aphanomyces stellatus]VFT83216.1 Aste57867_6215 [Aphanomyces stellatus]
MVCPPSYVKRVRRTCRLPPPVHGDVWLRLLRLLFRMLPVNCHFAYFQVDRPHEICCAYGCGHVETQHHALHTCFHISPVWTFHRDAWSRFGVTFLWSTILDVNLFSVNEYGDRLKAALKTLWTLLMAAVLHLIWTEHNKATSVRRWVRLQDPDCPVRSSALEVMATLRVQGGYRALWAKYPNSLLLAPAATAEPRARH